MVCRFGEWDLSLCTVSGQGSPSMTSSSHESVPPQAGCFLPVASWCLYIVRLCIGVSECGARRPHALQGSNLTDDGCMRKMLYIEYKLSWISVA